MGKPAFVPLAHRRALNQAILFSGRAPACVAALEPRELIRVLRMTLRMSQAQLARRSGFSQAQLARFEKGRSDIRLSTLRHLLDAMFCDLLILPQARKRPSEAVAERELQKGVRQGPLIWG